MVKRNPRNRSLKISIGSRNPVKIKAVKNVIKKIWPKAEIISLNIDSGVNNQPMSNKEAIKGANNRAKLSLEKTNSDLGLGLEGCVYDSSFGMFLSGWVVVIDKKGKIGIGSGGCLLLPDKIAKEIKKGKELGMVMDELIKEHNTKQKQGTVGVLTNNLINRTESFEKAIIFALTKFISPQYY
ncbi:MAG: inosine/xanthosine triphosphatase [Candidatus Pacebacteria bacterium]|nr:inosine/xanthosine triphosphatase [Candidatus Paceibacterota bacterium]